MTASALRRYNETMITKVTEEKLMQAAAIHAEARRASHAPFCSPEFVQAHTTRRQAGYICGEMAQGRGYGARLLRYAQAQCVGMPTLWG